jgi:hypothetical protein
MAFFPGKTVILVVLFLIVFDEVLTQQLDPKLGLNLFKPGKVSLLRHLLLQFNQESRVCSTYVVGFSYPVSPCHVVAKSHRVPYLPLNTKAPAVLVEMELKVSLKNTLNVMEWPPT